MLGKLVMASLLEELAGWGAALRFEDIPAPVVEKAKLQVLSVLAAVFAGYPMRSVRALREIALSTRANGRSRVYPAGDRTSPTVAVMANAAASMALDYDDYLFLGHTGHSAVLGALAFAEEVGAGGRQLLRAQIVANELGGRLGASVMLGPQNGQLWTHLHAVCAAAAAACLLELDARTGAHALALSLYQPPLAQWTGFLGPDSKLLSAAFPARDGLLAARAAAWGLTGPLDILENRRGFGTNFALSFLPQMFSGLGRAWVTDTLCFKMVPGCAYLSAAVEAMERLFARFLAEKGRPLDPSDVVRGTVYTTLLGREMERLSAEAGTQELRPGWLNFSLRYSLGVVLLAGRLTPAELYEEWLAANRERLTASAERFSVRHDWSLSLDLLESWSSHFPLAGWLKAAGWRRLLSALPGGRDALHGFGPRESWRIGKLLLAAGRGSADAGFDLGRARLEQLQLPFAARVELQLRRRERMAETVRLPAGAAGRDAAETAGLVRKKFRETATPLLGGERTERAIDIIAGLERLDSLEPLAAALCLAG